MNSEKVKEIKKALEVYGKENKGITILRGGEIQAIPYTDILTLINELESENERLLNEKWDKEDDLDNYHEENQQLKDRIAELENTIKNNLQYTKGYGDGVKATVEVAYPKKLNEFAERLKEKLKEKVNADNVDVFVECAKLSNETLKEFISGEVKRED